MGRYRWLFLILLLLLTGMADADTLDDVRQRQQLIVGVRTDYPPFGFRDADGEIRGFEVDLARALAERLGVSLALRPVASLDRTALLQRGEADLLIATLTDDHPRRHQALLIQPGYYASGTNALARRSTHLQAWSDLQGRTVCGVQGSPAIRQARQRLETHVLDLVTTPAALSTLQRRLCVALVHDSSVLISELRKPEWQEDFFMPLLALDATPWRLAVRDAEERWAAWLSATLVAWHREGRLLALQSTWQLPPSAYLRNMHLSYTHPRPHRD